MKKLFIILGFFAVMMGMAIWEVVATDRFYSETLRLLGELDSGFITYDEVADAHNLAVLDELEKHWDEGRNLVLTFGNHTVVRNADERVTALCEFTRLNERSDASVMLRQAQRYIGDLRKDVYPGMTNIF